MGPDLRHLACCGQDELPGFGDVASDDVFVPPFVPHREENPDPNDEAVVVIARTTQEAVVVNLDGLDWAQVDPSAPRSAGPSGR